MDVEYVVRADRHKKGGGDVVQAVRYAELMEARGVNTTISSGRPTGRGICHVFSLDRPCDLLRALRGVDHQPVVVSTIHHSREHLAAFRRRRRGLLGLAERHAPEPLVEVAKDRIRMSREQSRSFLTEPVDLPTSRRLRMALDRADSVQVLARGEEAWVREDFDYSGPCTLVPNGVDSMRHVAGALDRVHDVTVVGRIEERKNQLEIARVLAGRDMQVVFLGAPNPVSRSYIRDFVSVVESADNLRWLGARPREEVESILARTSVSLSASYYEVLSLGDLEAATAGCRVVASIFGNTKEFLGPMALYIDPFALAETLVDTLRKASQIGPMPFPDDLPTWDAVGDILFQEYCAVQERGWQGA